jgi:CDP-glycerol glycerophosphotransferase
MKIDIIQYFKIIVIYCFRFILKIFYIIPIDKEKILFSSYEGKQYACNPKYIFEYMMEQYNNNFLYVWAIKDCNLIPRQYFNIKTVNYLSLRYLYHALTAGYIIYNSLVKCYIPFRKNQIIVNTWHGGGAYKKMSIDANERINNYLSIKSAIKMRSRMVNYIISSCEKFTSVSSELWDVPKNKYMPIGMPRNDILFIKNDSIKEKVMKYFNIDNKTKYILYAPTYRGNYKKINSIDITIDISLLLNALKNKFKYDFHFLYRSHIFDKNLNKINNIIDATDYQDMQELLYATDILVTDYSSSIWDFSFTFKPCFLYAPDLSKYKEAIGFYTDIEEWPFSLAKTNKELIDNIMKFDQEKYNYSVKKHHINLGSYETGTATKQFCETVFK